MPRWILALLLALATPVIPVHAQAQVEQDIQNEGNRPAASRPLRPASADRPRAPHGVARQSPSTPSVLTDGPHVLWDGDLARIYRVRGNRVEMEEKRGAFDLPLPGLSPVPVRLAPAAPEPSSFDLPCPPKIAAVSDIHGQFANFLRLLQAQRIVDERRRWIFGKGHLVIVGDIHDRGDQVTETCWFLRALDVQARRAGGRVHLVLGNHEHMMLKGDYRYLHPKYARTAEGMPTLADLFGARSELGRWLRVQPVALKLGPFVFVHGGFSPDFLAQGLDLAGLNAAFRRVWERPAGSGKSFLEGPAGPIWYRGILPQEKQPASVSDVEALLRHFGVKAFVVGHTILPRITVFHGGRVFAIDTGLTDGQPGEAWIWERGKIWRGLADGRREEIQPN